MFRALPTACGAGPLHLQGPQQLSFGSVSSVCIPGVRTLLLRDSWGFMYQL